MQELTIASADGRNAAQSLRDVQGGFLLYLAAYVGAFVSFIPFFSILLPLKVQAIAPETTLRLLSLVTIAGVFAASVSNILFGMLSDRTYRSTGSRRSWIAGGCIGVALAYGGMRLASTPAALVAAVIFLQCMINMMFAPLVAVIADEVPDRWKGRTAAALSIAHPLASLSGAILLLAPRAGESAQLMILSAVTLAAILPFCLRYREGGRGSEAPPGDAARTLGMPLAWASRLLVQAAAASVATYVFIHFSTATLAGHSAAGMVHQKIAAIMAMGTIVAVPAAFLAGSASDRLGQRKPFLVLAGLGMSAGLFGVAFPISWWWAGGAYTLFMTSYCIFVGVHSAYTLSILSRFHRGRDLGVLNLTNTLPSLVAPGVILTMQSTSLSAIFMFVAGATSVAALLVSFLPENRAGGALG
ncbi:MFS transporter [Allosphingosinicella flava]|uniref:MFS transporter n=1 Tax=Allosphingosinicella flava TaxID=2771430 RepID=A0A7T2GI88_9SPHN|nr:MFS transporter [Sphingosinicella flava]QPQ54357.1 MFS transporter [Sphingosinicella flava]